MERGEQALLMRTQRMDRPTSGQCQPDDIEIESMDSPAPPT